MEGLMPEGFQLAHKQAEAYESSSRTFMDGSARLLADEAMIRAGDVVLDLACGTGLVARHAALLVAPNGRVVGADINAAMLDVARLSVGGNVEWVESPCDRLPFDDDTFSHVICQQGFQFFPDPVAAMSEVRRVLRPGGLLIATIWATPGHNPYIENQLELLAGLDPSLLGSVQRATPTNADDLLRAAATSAGFEHVEVTLLEHTVEFTDFERFFLAQTSATPWGPTLETLNDSGRSALATAMAARVGQYATSDGRYCIPFRSYRLAAHRLDGQLVE
jgi:ubiquinone/menaquinone biosynthesis C-methylase UbiE